MKKIYIILLFPFMLFSQEEKLRFEIIDVFKDYSPVIANSIKINNQPIYNDTLQEKIISNKPILTRNILLRELINFEHPSKFQLHQSNIYFENSASLEIGSHSFFQTKLHYNNGLSVRHNSGFNLQLSTEDYSLKSPYYKKNNGDFFRQIQLYTTRFLKNKILKTDFQINSLSGLYWGGLENVNMSDIADYKGSNITFNTSLNQNTANSFFQSADLRFNYFLNNYNRTEISLLSRINLQTTRSLKKYSFNFSGQLFKSSVDNSLQLSTPLHTSVSSYIGNSVDLSSFGDILVSSNFLLSGNKTFDYHVGFNISYGQLSSDGSSNFILLPALKLFKKIGDLKSIEFEFNKKLKYHPFNDLFETIPFVDPYFRNFFSQDLKTSFSYRHLLTQNLSFFNLINYNHIQDRAVPFLYDLYDLRMMNPTGVYLSDFQGFDIVSSLSWARSTYEVIFSLYLNSIKSNEHLNQSFISNKINTTINIKILNDLNLLADCYYMGDKDALRLSATDDNISYVVLPSYFSANLSLRYMFKNKIFSLKILNLFNQRYSHFDGYYDNDGFKLRVGFSYRF
ncbi:MAG: hypothetical protein CMD27_02560 [Flavobacteriales bacterium]|nr:hypothetical protein [Flavobacteriales bacterium]|tara:strand:+ start:141 stop:1838 length:1698 start_codon:yes stop_codon:yes gene_type:complete